MLYLYYLLSCLTDPKHIPEKKIHGYVEQTLKKHDWACVQTSESTFLWIDYVLRMTLYK